MDNGGGVPEDKTNRRFFAETEARRWHVRHTPEGGPTLLWYAQAAVLGLKSDGASAFLSTDRSRSQAKCGPAKPLRLGELGRVASLPGTLGQPTQEPPPPHPRGALPGPGQCPWQKPLGHPFPVGGDPKTAGVGHVASLVWAEASTVTTLVCVSCGVTPPPPLLGPAMCRFGTIWVYISGGDSPA